MELHAVDLNIDAATISLKSDDDPDLSLGDQNITYDYQREIVSIYFNQSCKPNSSYIIFMEYSGLIREKLDGFYRSSYIEQSDKKI